MKSSQSMSQMTKLGQSNVHTGEFKKTFTKDFKYSGTVGRSGR
jgi:hypothetical protein